MKTTIPLEKSGSIAEEQLYQLIFENAAVGIAQINFDGRFLKVNKKIEEITGYTKEELLQKSFPEITHPDDLDEDIKKAEALYRGEIPSYSMEKRYIRKDGTFVWIRLTGSAVFNAHGNFIHFIAVIEDISEKKTAEEALFKSEQRFKLASSAAKIGAYARNHVTGEDYWSPEFLELYGLNPGTELNLKEGIPKAVHPDDREAVLAQAKIHYSHGGGPEYNSEHRIVLPDGRIRWVNVRGQTDFDENDHPLQTYGIAMDITERRQAEEALRKSEEKYRTLFESIDEGFCICEMLFDEQGKPYDYRWLEINPTWEQHTGLKSPVGKTALELVPGLEQHWIDIYGKVALTGESIRFQQNSEPMGRWFDVFAFRVGNPGKHQFGLLFKDITAQKQFEETLRQKIEENEKLMDIMPAAVFYSNDPNCDHVWVNRMARSFYELGKNSNASANASTDRRFFRNGTELTPAELPMQKAARENREFINEALDVLLPSGNWLHMHGSAIPLNDENGNVRGAMAAFVDITQHIKTERALRESEEKFRMLANNISQLAWMADKDGKIFWFNNRWLEYTGITQEEAEGWGWTKQHHPEYIDRVLEKRKQAWAAGEPWEDTFPLKGKNGRYRWFLSRAVPIRDSGGNVVRWFGTNTDVTKQREYEQQLKKDNKLFENLLYIAAHDLKGPVANMHGALNLMENLPVEKKLMFLERFRELADQLDDTIQGVTEILRIRNTNQTAVSEIKLADLCNKIQLEFNNELLNATVKHQFEKQAVYYFRPYLHSILKNLISNSIKYCRHEVPLQIEISSKAAGSYTLITVSDNGIGIDLNKHSERLFKPFERLVNKKVKGSGIGLFLIKDIIEKNGGYIEVESTPGEGTSFLCYLKEY